MDGVYTNTGNGARIVMWKEMRTHTNTCISCVSFQPDFLKLFGGTGWKKMEQATRTRQRISSVALYASWIHVHSCWLCSCVSVLVVVRVSGVRRWYSRSSRIVHTVHTQHVSESDMRLRGQITCRSILNRRNLLFDGNNKLHRIVCTWNGCFEYGLVYGSNPQQHCMAWSPHKKSRLRHLCVVVVRLAEWKYCRWLGAQSDAYEQTHCRCSICVAVCAVPCVSRLLWVLGHLFSNVLINRFNSITSKIVVSMMFSSVSHKKSLYCSSSPLLTPPTALHTSARAQCTSIRGEFMKWKFDRRHCHRLCRTENP